MGLFSRKGRCPDCGKRMGRRHDNYTQCPAYQATIARQPTSSNVETLDGVVEQRMSTAAAHQGIINVHEYHPPAPEVVARGMKRRARIYALAAGVMAFMPTVTSINPAMAYGGTAGLVIAAVGVGVAANIKEQNAR